MNSLKLDIDIKDTYRNAIEEIMYSGYTPESHISEEDMGKLCLLYSRDNLDNNGDYEIPINCATLINYIIYKTEASEKVVREQMIEQMLHAHEEDVESDLLNLYPVYQRQIEEEKRAESGMVKSLFARAIENDY